MNINKDIQLTQSFCSDCKLEVYANILSILRFKNLQTLKLCGYCSLKAKTDMIRHINKMEYV